MAFCSNCGTQAADDALYCATCGKALTPPSTAPGAVQTQSMSPPDVVYAGFVRRVAALMLDGLILGIPVAIVAAVIAIAAGAGSEEGAINAIFYLIYLLSAPLYYALQESSSAQATLGKRALGIKVVDLQGKRISFGRALGRWIATALSYLTLYIGFLMAAFTQRKQALHDFVAGTLVVDKYAYTDQPQLQKRHLSGCLVVFIVGFLLVIPVTAILAAIALPAYNNYRIRAAEGACLAEAKAYMNTAVSAGLSEQPIPSPNARYCRPMQPLTREDIQNSEPVVFEPFPPGVAPTICNSGDATCAIQKPD